MPAVAPVRRSAVARPTAPRRRPLAVHVHRVSKTKGALPQTSVNALCLRAAIYSARKSPCILALESKPALPAKANLKTPLRAYSRFHALKVLFCSKRSPKVDMYIRMYMHM